MNLETNKIENNQIKNDIQSVEITKTKMQKQMEVKEKVKNGIKSNKFVIILLLLIGAFIICLPILYSILRTR